MSEAKSSPESEASSSTAVPVPAQSGLVPVDGVCVYYELFGAGHPLVFVPGLIVDSRIWDDQVAEFAKCYQVLRFDLRGSGRSESSPDPFTYLRDMATVLQTLHLAHAPLVSIADGATVAVEYALEYPDQVEALVLADPTVIRGYIPASISNEAWAKLAGMFSHLTGATDKERLQQFFEFGINMPGSAPTAASPEALERLRTMGTEYYRRLLACEDLQEWYNQQQQAWLAPHAFGRLSEIHVPTLILVKGPVGPDFQLYLDALTQAIAGAKVVVRPTESAYLNMEQPHLFNQLVLDFLAETW
jgi:3-oxoadipate enol-lactonase